MSKSKVENKMTTYKKLENILSASKIKVLHKMTSIKKAANHNYMVALLSKKIFETVHTSYGFDSNIYKNEFKSIKNINLIFIEEDQTLSHSKQRVISSLLKNFRVNDLNIIISDIETKIEEIDIEIYKNIKPHDMYALSSELTYRYSTGEFKSINVYSSIHDGKPKTIVPISNLETPKNFKYEDAVNSKTLFMPSMDLVLEKAFLDYLNGIVSYYYTNGKYIDLKKTLLKHESSIDHVTEKLDELKGSLNKIRQYKLTEDILLSYKRSDDD